MKLKPLLTTLFVFILSKAYASNILPTGGQVLFGNADLYNNKKNMYITSTTAKNVITWDDFSVGSENAVVFDKNSYLNLVKGNKASIIEGNIHCIDNKDFFLVNPNGITLTKTGNIAANKVVLSTSKVSEDTVDNFITTGDFNVVPKGMGKISLSGKIQATNLIIDGGQVIIGDIENLTSSVKNDDEHVYLGKGKKDNLKIHSSTNRIDVGGNASLDLENTYNLSKDRGLVDHTGQTAIGTKDEFLALNDNLNGNFFFTNDIDLGELSSPVCNSFTGSIDGTFNTITYKLTSKGDTPYVGLFSKLENSNISNLRIDGASISIDTPSKDIFVGGLCGSMIGTELSNVEVNNLKLALPSINENRITIGAIAGVTSNNNNNIKTSFKNVSGGFAASTQTKILNNNNIVAGTLIGELNDEIGLSDSVFGKINFKDSINSVEQLSAILSIGQNNSKTVIENDFKQDNKEYILFNDSYSLKNFYTPFYLQSDISMTFNENNSNKLTYSDFVDNPYFKTEDYVTIQKDYSGFIYESGTYNHSYSNKDGGTAFYFIKDDTPSETVTHKITIADKELPSPFDPDVEIDKDFTIDEDISINDPLIDNDFLIKAQETVTDEIKEPQGSLDSNEDLSFDNNDKYQYIIQLENKNDDISHLKGKLSEDKTISYSLKEYKSMLSIFTNFNLTQGLFSKQLLASLNLDEKDLEKEKVLAKDQTNQTNMNS